MDYREMEGAVLDAYRRRNYALCYALIDPFITTTDASDKARALSLKAGLISQTDDRRALEGLTLIDEALSVVRNDPQATLLSLVTGLSLCAAIGDVERGSKYENLGHRLLHEYGNDQNVQASRYRLHLNLGILAAFRGEHPVAYWHFMQGTSSLLAAGADDGSDGRSWLFWFYHHTATACLAMGRLPEAEEALTQAEKLVESDTQRLRSLLGRAELLRQHGRPHEAAIALATIEQASCEAWDAESRTRFLIMQALIAQDLHDLRGFHRHLSRARTEAADHSLDFLLSDIQRIQRGRAVNPNLGGSL